MHLYLILVKKAAQELISITGIIFLLICDLKLVQAQCCESITNINYVKKSYSPFWHMIDHYTAITHV